MKKNHYLFSLVVCTFNRNGYLERVLMSLIKQNFDKRLFEVLVVDNGSESKTKKLVSVLKQKFRLPEMQYLKEEKQGLGFARNKGYLNASGLYIGFIDDDAIADRNWLKTTFNNLNSFDLKLIAIGGIVRPIYEAEKPVWFKDSYETYGYGEISRFLNKGEPLNGPNMFIKKSILEKLGGFDARVGMKGKYISGGEETALFEKIWKNLNYEKLIFYSNKILVKHLIHRYKFNPLYYLKRSFAFGQAWALRHSLNIFFKIKWSLIGLSVSLLRVLFAVISLPLYRYREQWLVEHVAKLSFWIGVVVGTLGLEIPIRQSE